MTKKWGKKTREIFFPETHVYRKQKTMEKNRLEKVRKHVFYKHTNIVTKNRGKNAGETFSKKKTNRVSKKCWKKIVSKKCEELFSIKHMNIVTKKGGKARKKITRKKRISGAKNDGKNRLEKVRKHVFL